MSELSRWKEYRIRQAIYSESLKQSRWMSDQRRADEKHPADNPKGAERWCQDRSHFPRSRRVFNRAEHRFVSTVLHSGLFLGGAAVCLWLWWIELGFHW
jgi:hypothetical protein